uniref:Serpentine receptor class gamma n=1 Tax=Globodera rostochiensis TaxID=31243 RepID=A0A914HTR0_GLORO
MMDIAEWSYSKQTQIIYLAICIIIPSTALYIAQIVTIVRHKKFHNSFYTLFVMRAIPDLLYVLNSFYGQRMPFLFGVLYPIYSKFPNWMLAIYYFFGGHTFLANNLVTAFILLNRLTAIAMPIKHEKTWRKFLPFITIFVYVVPILVCWPAFKMNAILILRNQNSTTDNSFLVFEAGNTPTSIYLATFLGHMLSASLYLINIISPRGDLKIRFMVFVYEPLILDTGTVVFSSWLLLWASVTFRKQLIKDFSIIRKTTNIQNNRVGPMEGARNNNHRGVFRGSVGYQLQIRFCSSVQLPTIS